ncbi:MFS transporter [Corynebacterium macclintockiae]|uniref:MFS transporter n=1 Tax=Corynebacterium macclintockiae TaxID=2913501 RepID=UPI00254E0E0F|nr:MFS transporter [Corynebacterium macclintockiae]MDK8891624.1 MFS transporter [Corynebacterium macclintockiae]
MTGTREDTETTNGIRPLTPEDNGYKKALIASLCSGLASYNALYATQAVLPALSEDFGVSPSLAALTVSATTGGLALLVIPLSIVSERFGRRRVIQASVLAATLFSLALVTLPSIQSIIAVRLLQGIAVAGVPAVTMAFLSEEIDRRYLPRIMGFYIAGNSLGGLIGRLIPGIALEFTDWRLATLLSAIFAFAMALMTTWVLPKQRFFTPKRITLAHELQAFANHLRDPILLKLFLLPFLLMGSFVSLYNYMTFRLINTFGLPESLAALVFIIYLSGTWTSTRTGTMVNRYGQAKVVVACIALALVGLFLAFIPTVPTTLAAVLLFTATFFPAHSISSAWVGEVARQDRAEASSIYILSYYLGSSIIGWVSGYFFAHSWGLLVAWLILLTLIALVTALAAMRRDKAISS